MSNISHSNLFLKLQLINYNHSLQHQLQSQDFEREITEPNTTFNNIQVSGKIGTTSTIVFISSSLDLRLELKLNLTPCPPGYYRQESDIYKCLMCPSGC